MSGVMAALLRMVAALLLLTAILFAIPVAGQYFDDAQEYRLMQQVTRVTQPVIALLQENAPTRIRGYEAAPWIIIILAMIFRGTVQSVGERFRLRAEYATQELALSRLQKEMSPRSEAMQALDSKLDQARNATRKKDRAALLRQFIEAKQKLEEAQKDLAFLSIDVIGSTGMKNGEDAPVIEYSFGEYKKLVESILTANKIWKVAWTPDGIMCAFPDADNAVDAARDLLNELDAFNARSNQMRLPFAVRCGINYGKVMFDDDANMEDVSDHVIDVAGHLQKYASANTVWISKEAWQRLTGQEGFTPVDRAVDGHDVLEYKPT
jgi:class 3 adenylate cyclase